MLPLPCDVSDPDAVDGMFTRIESAFDRLDLLFNNAGTNVPATNFGELSWSAWKKVIDVNLNGMFLCASGAFRLMQRQRPQGGRIINNGSISAHAPRPGRSEEHTSELQSLMRISYAVFSLKKKNEAKCLRSAVHSALTLGHSLT